MQKIILIPILLLAALLMGACVESRTEESTVLYEEAVVVDLVYTPSLHGSGLNPTISMNGDLGLAITDVDVPQKYAVVFQCAHGKFIIENDQEKAKKLWENLKQGQKVVVSYREIYRAEFRNDSLLGRSLVKYDFLDAK